MGTDAITLSFPHKSPYHGVARLVVGGLAARLDLSYEHLEDLQLAVESVLERGGYVSGPEVTVRLDVDEDAVSVLVGPLDPTALRADLERESPEGISMRRLLETLVQDVAIVEADSAHWLRLEKRAPLQRPSRSAEGV
ncbi:MAG TPA: hypothetical protein VK915_04685 [Gaiellaceae bacterium]|nr:hypothetical protein [Gaiellaceae bacterium]